MQGTAIEQPPGLLSRDLGVGTPVHLNSEIRTGKDSRLEITFSDKSRMVLGEWAYIRLDSYRHGGDDSRRNESQVIRIITGTFRFITGLIGKFRREKVRLETPVATIGIRGTDFFGGPLAAGMPPGEIHYGFMAIDGAINVSNSKGAVTLDEPNEGTFLPMAGGKAPTPPSAWKQPAIDEAFGSIEFQ